MFEQKMNNNLDEARMMASFLLAKGFKSDKAFNSYTLDVLDKFIPELPKVEKGSSIAANLLLIKIPSYGVNITPPDWLIYLIELCANGNPGYIQLIYKELLTFINNASYGGTGLPQDYKIEALDFANCFRHDYPIILDPKMEEKYSKLWDEQKRETHHSFESDNRCDTKEYWMEIMYKG